MAGLFRDFNQLEYEALVDRIYEAALVPEHWLPLLDRISELTGSIGGSVISMDLVTPRESRFIASGEVDHLLTRFFSEGWGEKNARIQFGTKNGIAYAPRFITEADIFRPEDRYEEQPMYRDFLSSLDAGRSAGTVISHVDGLVSLFSFERRHRDGPYDSDQIAILDYLRPHLARASVLAQRNAHERAKAYADTLSVLGIAGGVLSFRMELVAYNDLLTSCKDVVFRAGSKIGLMDAKAHEILTETLLQRNNEHPAAVSIPVRNDDGFLSRVVNVIPLRRSARDIFGKGTALFVVNERARTVTTPEQATIALFDLTPAEAAVAAGISMGRTVREISVERGRSLETVRAQLKSVMAKTGCSSQNQLVALLSTITPSGGPTLQP